MDVKTIGKIVRKKRKELGLTQVYLAALSNTGVRFISERKRKPTLELGGFTCFKGFKH